MAQAGSRAAGISAGAKTLPTRTFCEAPKRVTMRTMRATPRMRRDVTAPIMAVLQRTATQAEADTKARGAVLRYAAELTTSPVLRRTGTLAVEMLPQAAAVPRGTAPFCSHVHATSGILVLRRTGGGSLTLPAL